MGELTVDLLAASAFTTLNFVESMVFFFIPLLRDCHGLVAERGRRCKAELLPTWLHASATSSPTVFSWRMKEEFAKKVEVSVFTSEIDISYTRCVHFRSDDRSVTASVDCGGVAVGAWFGGQNIVSNDLFPSFRMRNHLHTEGEGVYTADR